MPEPRRAPVRGGGGGGGERGAADVIVIGSGIGGLGTAALLARAGMRVVVLERHTVAGGLTHTFKRGALEWDVGLHYVGKVHDPASRLRRVFDFVTDGALEWADVGAIYDRAVFPDRSYDFVAGRAALEESLAGAFPGERGAVRAYLDCVARVERRAQLYFLERALPRALGTIASPLLCCGFRKHSDVTTASALARATRDDRLRGVLAAQWGNLGAPPAWSSFAMQALVTEFYLGGAAYPVGGAGRIAADVTRAIERDGGEVRTRAEVERIVVDGKRAIGVVLTSGEALFAKTIVSDVGAAATLGRLLPPEARPAALLAELARVGRSPGHVCLYVGLRGEPEELGLERANHWVHASYDHDRAYQAWTRSPRPRGAAPSLVYVSCASAKDPSWTARHPGRATLTAIAPAPYEWFARWRDTRWRKRGAEYDELKAELAGLLLAHVHAIYPRTRGRVEHAELSTPLSMEHFAAHERGAMYGLDHGPERFRVRGLRAMTPVRGLYLTGQDVVTVGVGASLLSAVLTASAILRRSALPGRPRALEGTDEAVSAPVPNAARLAHARADRSARGGGDALARGAGRSRSLRSHEQRALSGADGPGADRLPDPRRAAR